MERSSCGCPLAPGVCNIPALPQVQRQPWHLQCRWLCRPWVLPRAVACGCALLLGSTSRADTTELESLLDVLLLDCDGSEPWLSFRRARLASGGAPCTSEVFNHALAAWNSIDWASASAHIGGETSLEVSPPETRLSSQFTTVDKDLQRWMQKATMLLSQSQALAQGWGSTTEDGVWLPSTAQVLYDCPFRDFGPYALLMVQHVMLQCMHRSARHELERPLRLIRDNLFALFEVLLDFPAHTFDFLESSSWNTSSFDLAVTLIGTDPENREPMYASFEDYAAAHPVSAPFLPTWKSDVDPSLAWTWKAVPQARARAELRQMLGAGGSGSSVVVLNLHDAGSWDEWHSLLAGLGGLLDPLGDGKREDENGQSGDASTWESPAGLLERVVPRWFFTRVHALSTCPEGATIRGSVVMGFDTLRKVFDQAQRGSLTLDGFRQWIRTVWDGSEQLRTADIVLCSEPFVLCPLLDAIRGRPMIGRFNMALLNEYHFGSGDLDTWWADFYGLIERADVLVSVASRITVEQVFHQTGVRLPYVPYLALQLRSHRPSSPSESGVGASGGAGDEVLLFHNNRPALLAFRDALRLFYQAGGHAYSDLKLRDMNSAGRALCRPEMASFKAAVLLPHAPNAIRLIDLYALGVLMFVPGEPLIHKYIWNNRGFAGHESPFLLWRSVAREPLRLRWRARTQRQRDTEDLPSGHPPFSPWEHLHDWSLHKRLDARRYWVQYTEWVTLPGLQKFYSIPGLLDGLLTLVAGVAGSAAVRARAQMAEHHAKLCAEAIEWWRAAATLALLR